jgi:uncharacterized protein
MKKRIGTLLVGAPALALPGTATSGQLEDGLAAYQSKDYEMALRLFRPLAVQGDAKAQALLGSMYQIGDGVPQDYAEAANWYRKAADQGYDGAQAMLGDMYKEGRGVQQDDVLAYMWLSLAAAQDNDDARKDRDLLAKLMTPAQIAEAQRRANDWKPISRSPQQPR